MATNGTAGEKEHSKHIHEAFHKSRNGAIIRCASIMVDANRKDLARQILETTCIDQKRLAEIKNQNA